MFTWPQLQEARLEANPEKLWTLNEMERTGGEPDVVVTTKTANSSFMTVPRKSEGRRSLCYDREALDARKENKPKDSALDMAGAMGIELLTEDQYRELQRLGNFDTKTSSWVKHLLRSENSEAPSFVIAATTQSSCITTARNLTTPPEDSAAASESKRSRGVSPGLTGKLPSGAGFALNF